ncbi:DVUA0089 family protein [Tundrisphaera sp. TA3]|uniref:DVUA0089 family protein n=1 Tax=Tundrisphaera sp. TA3 TaxID=3435775 RepID=UPI003EBE2A75
MKSPGTFIWACVALFLLAPRADATFWVEAGDAGQLPNAAQVVLGDSSPLTGISGSLSSTGDRDMYLIYITGGGTFSATTVGQPGTLLDTQLFLFNAAGRGVYANDDDAAGEGFNQYRSTLPANGPLTPLAAGFYYLLITASPIFPTGTGGVIFPNYTTPGGSGTAVVGPTGPGGGSVITGYTGTGVEFGSYQIALTGATAVPEPSSLASAGIAGVVGLLALARRRRRAA